MIKDQEFRDPLLALQQIRKTHPNPENLAVTFTEIDKVGLNPQNRYETPLGIYLYPLDYVIENKMNVPFAGDEPYINVCEFTRPQKILQMTSDISNQKGEQLLNVFPKKEVDEVNLRYREGLNIKYHLRSNYSKLWLVTRILANNKPTQWNINLRKCGIDGFMDHGTGTIHSSEPTQCVVFAANNLKLLHSIDNPAFDKTTDKFGVDTYKIKTFKYDSSKMSDEQIIRMLQSRRTLDVKNLLQSATDKDKMADVIVKNKPELSTFDAENLLHFATDDNKDKIAELIIKKKSNLFSVITKLITYAKDKDKIVELIINKKSKLSDNNVASLLQSATDKDKIAKLLGIKNIKNIIDADVRRLLDSATDKDKMAELLMKYKAKISDDNFHYIFSYVNNKDKTAETFIKYKKNLSNDDVARLITYAEDKDKIAEILQKKADYISELSKDSIYYLLQYQTKEDKKQMAQIINKYHTKKTPEIQEILYKYLTQTKAAK